MAFDETKKQNEYSHDQLLSRLNSVDIDVPRYLVTNWVTRERSKNKNVRKLFESFKSKFELNDKLNGCFTGKNRSKKGDFITCKTYESARYRWDKPVSSFKLHSTKLANQKNDKIRL